MPELLYSSSKSSSPTPSPVCRSRPRSHDHHTLLHFSSRTRPLPLPSPSMCNFFVYENRYFTANHQHFGGVEKTFVIHRVSPRGYKSEPANRYIESPRSNVSRSLGTISILPIVHYLFRLIKREIFYTYIYTYIRIYFRFFVIVFLRLYLRLGRVLSVVTH